MLVSDDRFRETCLQNNGEYKGRRELHTSGDEPRLRVIRSRCWPDSALGLFVEIMCFEIPLNYSAEYSL